MQRNVMSSVWWGTLAALVLGSCGGAARTPEAVGQGSASAAGEGGLEVAQALTIVDDVSTGTSAMVTTLEGGSLSVTAADGTVFQLDVPAGALEADTEITGVAAATTEGITGATSLHTVRFEPEGLQFIGSAALTVTTPEAIAVDHALALTAAGDGTSPRLAELIVESDSLVIAVEHFSVFTLADVIAKVDGVRVAIASSVAASSITDGIYQDLEIRRAARTAGFGTDEVELRLQERMTQYLDEVVVPLVTTAGADCSSQLGAAHAVMDYYQIVTRNNIGGVTTMKATAQERVLLMEKACEPERIAECREAKDPAILTQFWAGMRGWKLFGGFVGVGNGRDDFARAKAICSSSYVASGGSPVTFSGTIDDLTAGFGLSGSGPGFSVGFAFSPTDANTGTVEYSGEGGGMTMQGSGTYTISGPPGGVLTLTYKTQGCVNGGTCANNTNSITLTPISG